MSSSGHHSAQRFRPLARIYVQALDRLYNDAAWAYEAVAWGISAGRWSRWRRRIVPHLVGRRVLEVGSGPGHLLASLAKAGYQAYGIDRSQAMVRLAAKRLRTRGCPSQIVRALAEELPFADETFDSIACTFPAPFILAQETMGEAWRVLRADGRLVILDGRPWFLGRRVHPIEKPSYTLLAEKAGFQVTYSRSRERHFHLELTVACRTTQERIG